ncbi:hypothetical protein RFI_20988 [Reticulomyxa filosa]|uniref:Histone RNA hairpin-binding protein RNA-binding domain-containing protein n=1 Tax=Reticulomyxa filosa TaxID=46433 RepID=X6MRF4_RETFI|nr:hypothetical protein RFI_20988 [Reticulomyxa filosa]|eukprot:ETO16364.1 hypothetical protein RFI_20988 [Reticulomyxa filosa]
MRVAETQNCSPSVKSIVERLHKQMLSAKSNEDRFRYDYYDLYSLRTLYKEFPHADSPMFKEIKRRQLDSNANIANEAKEGPSHDSLIVPDIFAPNLPSSKRPNIKLPFDVAILQRLKQIQLAKNTPGYQNYVRLIPRHQRLRSVHPMTPRADEDISKRRFQGKLNHWKKSLHDFDDMNNIRPALLAVKTPCKKKALARRPVYRSKQVGLEDTSGASTHLQPVSPLAITDSDHEKTTPHTTHTSASTNKQHPCYVSSSITKSVATTISNSNSNSNSERKDNDMSNSDFDTSLDWQMKVKLNFDASGDSDREGPLPTHTTASSEVLSQSQVLLCDQSTTSINENKQSHGLHNDNGSAVHTSPSAFFYFFFFYLFFLQFFAAFAKGRHFYTHIILELTETR